jgi:hypothetical protein
MDKVTLMKFSFTILLSLITSCANRVTDKSSISIKKVSEIIINFPSFEEKTMPFSYSSLFPQSFGIIDNRYIIFKKNYDYYHINMVNKSSKKICGFGFEPGATLFNPTSLSLSDSNEIVISDSPRRINIYTKNGDFKESYVTPATLGGIFSTKKINNKIIISDENITTLNTKTGEINKIFGFNDDDLERLKKRTPVDGHVFTLPFSVTPEGNLLIVKPMEPFIYEYSTKGDLIHKYEDIPMNYISINDIEPYKRGHKIVTTDWNQDQVKGQYGYHDRWSLSGNPFIFSKNYFIVPRRVYPPIHLDFYSLKSKKYLGHYNIGNKEFIIEKYEVDLEYKGEYKPSENDIERLVFTIENESKFDQNKNHSVFINEKEFHRVDSLVSINNIMIKDLEEKDKPLIDYLSNEKKYHFIINVRVFSDCGLAEVITDVKEFCQNNTGYDYNIIITHPFKDELKRSMKFFKFDASPIYNIDPERILGFYSNLDDSIYPKIQISLIDCKGNFLGNWKDKNFFKKVAKKFGAG